MNKIFAQLEWVDYRIAFLKEVKIEIENYENTSF